MYKLNRKQAVGLVGSALSITCFLTGFGFKNAHGFDASGYTVTLEADHSLNNFLNGHKNDLYHLSWPDSNVSITRGQLDQDLKDFRQYYTLPNGKKVYVKSGLDDTLPNLYLISTAGFGVFGIINSINKKDKYNDNYRDFNDYEEYYSNDDVKTFKKTR